EALVALLLPDCKQAKNKDLCGDNDSFFHEQQMTAAVERRSEQLPLSVVSRSDGGGEQTYSYSFSAGGGRQVLVRVAAGVTSKLDFALDKPYRAVHHLLDYPKRLDIMLDGMLLSLSGT